MTDYEITQREIAARNMQSFWETILKGDAILAGFVGTAGLASAGATATAAGTAESGAAEAGTLVPAAAQ